MSFRSRIPRPPKCKEPIYPHLSHLSEGSTTTRAILNYIVDQIHVLKVEVGDTSCTCTNLDRKFSSYIEEIKKELKQLKTKLNK